MAKRFKQKISGVIPSFQFCRSRNSSTCTIPSIHHLSPVNPKQFDITYPNTLPAPPPSTPKRHVSSKVALIDCNGNGSCRRYRLRMCRSSSRSSSRRKGVPSGGGCLLNSENEGSESESETLISSSSFASIFSYDSSFELDDDKSTESSGAEISEGEVKFVEKSTGAEVSSSLKENRRFGGRKKWRFSKEMKSDHSSSEMKEEMATVGEKVVRECVAVVKNSRNPYDDFKRSMVEMMVENEVLQDEELEEMLRCFLSLNSRKHHVVIVEAFMEIWNDLFACS